MNGGCQNIQNVHFFYHVYVSKEDIFAHEILQNKRFEGVKTVPGTRSNHCYIPSSDRSLIVKRISGEDSSFVTQLFLVPHKTGNSGQNFVAFSTRAVHWGIFYEHEDVLVSFMHHHGPTCNKVFTMV